METILKAVEEFASRMAAQGYHSSFLAESAYAGHLKECLLNYIGQAALGNEKGLKEGISLSTYLRWEGTGQDYIHARMYVRLIGDRFIMPKMILTAGNENGKIRELDFELNGKPVPTRSEALARIDPPKQKLKKKKGYRF
jgi:hypothetical protein